MTGELRPAVSCRAQSRVHVHDEECATQEAHAGRTEPEQAYSPPEAAAAARRHHGLASGLKGRLGQDAEGRLVHVLWLV